MGLSFWENLKDEERNLVRRSFETRFPGRSFLILDYTPGFTVLERFPASPQLPRQDHGDYVVSFEEIQEHQGNRHVIVDKIQLDHCIAFIYKLLSV